MGNIKKTALQRGNARGTVRKLATGNAGLRMAFELSNPSQAKNIHTRMGAVHFGRM
jgi:hypothetical protein